MARKSKIAKDNQRRVLVERHAGRRTELRATIASPAASDEEKEAARKALARLPRDSSPVRPRNRDAVDGRPRGFLRTAGVSRVRFREMAHAGELPGVTKSSW